MCRIVFLSDTHGQYEHLTIPDGDILVHSGDFGALGDVADLLCFHKWFTELPHQHKIFVAGNHDWCFERAPDVAQDIMKDTTYLQDKAAEISGLKFYGSPWQPRYHEWAFNLDRGAPLAAIWAKIPEGIDVLITHGPPFGILDYGVRSMNVGCEELLKRVREIKPLVHLFGHIHEGRGYKKVGDTFFLNGSMSDVTHHVCHEPIAFTLDKKQKRILI